MSDINQNEIIAKAVSDLITQFLKSMGAGLSHTMFSVWDRVAKQYTPYLNNTYNKCSKIKTILGHDKPIELENLYVQSYFKCDEQVISDVELMQRVRDNERIVVTGFGGIGKTIFMKKLWITIFLEPQGRMPLFIELRNMNDIEIIDLISFMRRSVNPLGREFDESAFHALAVGGEFLFILDGFDELKKERRKEVESEILKLAALFPNSGLVVAGRMDDRFGSWQNFNIYKTQPFTIKQVIELVNNLKYYNKSIIKRFVKHIKQHLTPQQEAFLSSPLLTIMMLITFSKTAEIPPQMHVFYDQAFSVLYNLHDATKEMFSRERPSNLGVHEFKRLLALFSLFTYFKNESEFSEASAVEYLSLALKQLKYDANAAECLEEIVESVNILQRDGLVYVFCHRSFQEYFAAFAIVNVVGSEAGQIIRGIADRYSDSVIVMAFEMNSDVVEEKYIIPGWIEFGNFFVKELDVINTDELLVKIKARLAIYLDKSIAGKVVRPGYLYDESGELVAFCRQVLILYSDRDEEVVEFYGIDRWLSDYRPLEVIAEKVVSLEGAGDGEKAKEKLIFLVEINWQSGRDRVAFEGGSTGGAADQFREKLKAEIAGGLFEEWGRSVKGNLRKVREICDRRRKDRGEVSRQIEEILKLK